jgi:hypothetical protein
MISLFVWLFSGHYQASRAGAAGLNRWRAAHNAARLALMSMQDSYVRDGAIEQRAREGARWWRRVKR